MKKMIRHRIPAMILAGAILAAQAACPAVAGPPKVDTDEALYVNLDYYGKQTDMSVVKGCSLNGIRSFTDYGVYTDVTNMSNYAQPQLFNGGVIWQLPADSKDRFYYECQLDGQSVILPWDFDVSYKLNGIPAEAPKLLHADGLVEMEIHCIPNEQADEYYRSNMILQVGTMVDMEDVNSIRAEGSQTQTLGTYKIIVFAAVPGEEKTFRMEIGTTDFESMGIIMLMVPGTLEQMKEIREIKEIKDTVSDSTDDLIDSLNELMTKLDNVTDGMETARAGLQELQKARENLDAAKDEISANMDQSLEELDALSAGLKALEPDINSNKEAIDQMNESVNQMVNTIRGSGDNLFELSGRFSDLQEDLDDLQSKVNASDVDGAKAALRDISATLDGIDSLLGGFPSEPTPAAASASDAGILPAWADEGMFDPDSVEETMDELNNYVEALLELSPVLYDEDALEDIRNSLSSLITNSGFAQNYRQLSDYVNQIRSFVRKARNMVDDMRAFIGGDLADNALEHGQEMSGELSILMGDLEHLVWDINGLNRTFNDNKRSLDQLLTDTASTAGSLASGSAGLADTMRSIQNTLKNNRGALESGTEKTLDGLIDLFEKASEGSTADKIKGANENIKNSVKDELDKVEEDTNLLDLDAEREMISFTSLKNKTPASIQVILRTQEITEEDLNTNAVDIEPAPAKSGLWQRIVNVFKRIWEAVAGIFR